jgi:hypothetical protein
MTSLAGPQPEPVLSSRAPYAPLVILIGASLVIAVIIRLLNAAPVVDHPMSGAPVGNGNAVVVTQSANRPATGSLSLLMPIGSSGDPISVGPAAFPPGSAVVLSVVLPAQDSTQVKVALSRLADDGTLETAEPIYVTVTPDEDGSARVSTTVDALTSQLGAGVYRVDLVWDGQRIGGTDVALGLAQPANVAIFEAPRHALFAAGQHTGIKPNPDGTVGDQKAFKLGKASGAPAAAFARFAGRDHVFISAGIWAGYWVPLDGSVTLD